MTHSLENRKNNFNKKEYKSNSFQKRQKIYERGAFQDTEKDENGIIVGRNAVRELL